MEVMAVMAEMEKGNTLNFDNMNQTLGHKFRMVNVGTDRYFHMMVERTGDGLPRAQGPMMGYLVDHLGEVIFQKDLEKAFHITGATVSNMLSSMEKAGLIERVQMEGDARLRRIVPTEQGILREIRVREQIQRMEDQMIKGFSEEEQKQLKDYLVRVADNIEALCREIQREEEHH